MRFGLLGELEIDGEDGPITIAAPKQRALLALLLLQRGKAVGVDRLAADLWGEEPPATATKTVQVYVAQLRKVLGEGVVVTRGRAYLIDVDAHELDLVRFEELAAEGRRLLADGDADAAAAVLRDALALWRGPPLADFTYEEFAQSEIARLEDERLDVIEARVEADIARGFDDGLVAELQTLVSAHPLRERLRGQLMIALYRSGRQAEALDEYRRTRRTLRDELGLEPSPALQELERAILAQDESLGSVPAIRRLRSATKRRGAVLVLAGGGLLLAAAAASIALILTRNGGGGTSASSGVAVPGYGGVVALDAATGTVRRRIAAGRTPSAIAMHEGVAWVVDADAQVVLRLSESSRVVETFSTGATPTDVAAGAGSVWVANGRPLERAQFVGPVATAVVRVDATTGTERGEIRLPRREGALSNLVENHLAARGGAVWAVTPDFTVVRIDATTGGITARSSAVRAAAVAAGPAGVWVLGVDGAVARLDERTARPIVRTSVPASSVGSIGVGEDAAWVTSPSDGTLWRIGGGPRPTLGAIELTRGVSDLAVGPSAIWVANPLAGTVVQVGIESAVVERTVDLDGIPQSVALDGDTLWVAVVADPTASTIKVSGIRPLPASTCERVLAGKGKADVLIVSDLALQGGARVTTTQMAQAIAFVLRERGFRAGSLRIAYQSCDDSVARTGLFDEAKCAANARAYAANPDVVGVIGTFNSLCAAAALPELNRAPGGPLAMISPFNSFVGLTRAGPGIDPSLPAALYPTGRRNYVRVYPTDDLQGAALALLARDRGRRQVFVLDDGDPGYGALMARGFETAARRLGLTVVGRTSWDPQAAGYAELAGRVARSGAKAVFLGGLLDSNAARVVRDLRTRLGTSVALLGPDGLTPLTLLVERAGRGAAGVFVSLAGAVTERLPRAGARFARRFGKTQAGVAIEPSAVYAAQAAEVLLDAIARSDGTRASVIEKLFATRVRDGLLGSFGFDANGDITESPVTIMRVARGGGSNRIASIEGGVVERVVRPSPRQVAAGK